MNAKQIAFIVLCVLLITVVIMTCVVVARVGGLLSGLTAPPSTTPTPTEPSAEATDPTQTVPPTEPETTPPTTVPTEPETTPPTTGADHEHDYVLTETGKPTCGEYGYSIYTCTICGQQDIPSDELTKPLGHNYGAGQVIAVTCETDGYTLFTCTRCGETDKRHVQKAPGHNFVLIETVAPGCETEGYELHRCENCNLEEHREVQPALEHNYILVETQNPTCESEGFELYYCDLCQTEKQIPLPKSEHTFGDWQTDESGYLYRSCAACLTTVSTQDMQITETKISAGDGNSCQIYLILVGIRTPGAEELPHILQYTVYDYREADTPTFQFDPIHGLKVTYIGTLGDEESFFISLLDTDPAIISAG